MVYEGQTARIETNRGGWNANINMDLVPPESMIDAVNLNLHRGGRETRGGVEKINATPITGLPRIMGIFQFRKVNGNTFTITVTSDGVIQKDFATNLKTGLAVNKKISFTVFKDKLYICNGSDRPQTWDGVAATTSDIVNIPTDWSGTNWPKAMVVHGRGASESLWAYGVPGFLGQIYVSANATDNFSDAQVTILKIETGDGFGVVALTEFKGLLIALGKRRAYLIDDVNASRTLWGYQPSQWEGGAATERLVVKTPNDLVVMDEDGEIYSVIKAQLSLDFKAASIARPAHIHVWIGDNADLSKIDDFHAVYDPGLRAVRIFLVRKNQASVDTALVYFIDRSPEEAWTRHRYFRDVFASSSTLFRVGVGDWKIYVGGQNGTAYKLESTTATDDGSYYYNGFTTPDLSFEDPRGDKQFDRTHLIIRQMGNEEIRSNLFIDGAAVAGGFNVVDELTNEVVDELGNQIVGYEFTPFIFTVQALPPLTRIRRLTTASHIIGLVGRRLQHEVFNAVIGERMFVAHILYDIKPLGPRPE